ncbi:MAG TPA: neutral zinc metallopeptidase [Methylomirabilota bacterium]|jgi:predicted metalloprotease
MRWTEFRRSDNVEDRRGMSMGGAGLKLGGGGLLLIVVLSLLTGTNPLDLLSGLEEAAPPTIDSGPERKPPADDPQADFVRAVVGDTEDTWGRLFSQGGGTYEPPRLVLFSGAVQSACGQASAAVGPFYCPPDRRVYLDLGFFRELSERFGAPGEFARAYVVAHEIGHHVQNLLGTSDRVQRQRQRADQASANALSVRLELQADCYAGVWGHSAAQRNILEPGDVEAALAAATAIGDDRLQKQARGYVVPESFTHGSSAQRVRWFRTGLETGDVRRCDTFAARS